MQDSVIITYYLSSLQNILQFFINETPSRGEIPMSHRTVICICSNKWLKNNEEKKTNKKNSRQVILFWNSTSRKIEVKYLFCAWKHCQSSGLFFDIFTKKNVWVPHHRWRLFFRSLGLVTTVNLCFVFFLSTYRVCNLNPLSLQAWTNHPAATAVRLAVKTCKSGLFCESLSGLGSSSSSSSWRDQPAQTWCHGESARVLHPKLTRQTSCEVGVTSSPGNRSLETVSKSRCRDECVSVSPHLPTGHLPQNSFVSSQPHELITEG